VTPRDGDPQAPLDRVTARKAAHEVREEARRCRNDVVEVASVDELVEVLVLLAGRHS
jgi:hypothetical protein